MIKGISVIIPVLHEANVINELIEYLRGLTSPVPVEIIVVDGAGEQDTISAIRDRDVVKSVSSAGRARQMNVGSKKATHDVFLFLHADTWLPQQAFGLIGETMKGGRWDAGAFDLGIDTKRRIFKITEAYVALRTRITRIPFGDQGIFLTRSLFERLDGDRDIPLMEDVDLMGRVKKSNGRVRIIPEKVSTSARRWEREGVLYSTVRNMMLQVMYAVGVPPERLKKYYRNEPERKKSRGELDADERG
ncbi:MAG TPA: glycosyl transferase [Nitrospiraceae bacterium]|nr:glycosyl transferase [Nitrospiraceae bacterium]